MIELNDLPDYILEVIKTYQKPGEEVVVFPSKFFIDGEYYYYVSFGVAQQLIVRTDGEVLPIEKIKKAGLIANAYVTSGFSIINNGDQMASSSFKKSYKKLLSSLVKIKDSLNNKIPAEIKSDLELFVGMTQSIIVEQDKLIQSVEKGKKQIDVTNQKEIVTEEDRNLLRKHSVDYVSASYKINELQLQTEEARNRVMEYLSLKRWLNPRLFFYYMDIKKIHDRLLTWEKLSEEEKEERKELKIMLENEVPLEQNPIALKHLNDLRNPRIG